MMVIDADNAVYGRLSTFVAKKLLEGEEVTILNADKVVVTGSRDFIINRFRERREIGSVRKGPYYPKTSREILRRSIGDMLPKKKTRGKEALHRCKVYSGFPEAFKGAQVVRVEKAMNRKVNGFVTLGEISRLLGQKV
ncbi:50S ribosomal protein L13 [Thermogymnomonas acidicola]|uniref:Large ribosomal subunit protein uL13 n=1 Tax=Thermogymnomonas acidicola TaxID=399579 RepID=A0AA37F9G6_9ARCH|nr:50S ribosomal protein L13 [Thermogymnomonas acidicola]GGM73156.1 50S ribosomal protein L13 [Thermogymnomonas acidicola]